MSVDPALRQAHIPFVETGSYPVRRGNRVRPLVDAVPTFRRIAAAVEGARHSVWMIAAFVTPDFALPDDHGTLFDMLDRAASRGLDVRVLFWRPSAEASRYGLTFAGTPADRDLLRARGALWRARWDSAPGVHCQHQKSWLIDAGTATETAFLGGMNLTARILGAPGHANAGGQHDAYVELAGPSATDVHHNFVQRWNEASERAAADGLWNHDAGERLAFPDRSSVPQGGSVVQIQRTISAGLYRDGHPTPGGVRHPIAEGERAIFAQYQKAIDAARRTIYIETQSPPVPEIAARLAAALARGVAIVMLLPAEPDEGVRAARRRGDRKAVFDSLAALAHHENFALAGLAAPNLRGARTPVYVHGKLMLIDDGWATIGSCNLHAYSLFGNAEMNASFWAPEIVRALRCALLVEHLGRDTAGLDDREALALYRRIARQNRRRWMARDGGWDGLAIAIDAATYGDEGLCAAVSKAEPVPRAVPGT